jgi:hypothetical protein
VIGRSTYGSLGIATMRWKQAQAELGDDHPKTRAALGRMRARLGHVPQRSSITPEAIAWHRETRANPGYLNRRHRRHLEAS